LLEKVNSLWEQVYLKV